MWGPLRGPLFEIAGRLRIRAGVGVVERSAERTLRGWKVLAQV